MAQVTVELGMLLDKTDFELFDFDYTFDDLQYKTELENHIIEYYFDYEIGFETPDLFKRKFKARFNRLVDYYNHLHNTTLLEYNILSNYSITEALDQLATVTNTQNNNVISTGGGSTITDNTTTTDQTTTNDNTATNNLTNTSNGGSGTITNEKSSDYPQQSIAGGDYLNGERITDSDTTNNNTTTNTGTVINSGGGTNDVTTIGGGTTTSTDDNETTGILTGGGTTDTDYTKTIEGLTGTSYQDLIAKERSNLIRITNMIIDELKTCFILVH